LEKMMKNIFAAALAGTLLFTACGASAVSLNAQVGQHYTDLGFGLGTATSGLALTGDWAHSDNDGNAAGIGLGYNIPVGPFMATVGGKGVYLDPKDGSVGYAAAVGGGLQLPLGNYFSLYGEGYYSPDSMSSGVNNYVEANAGVRLTAVPMVSVDVGYRYQALNNKSGNRDNVIADGIYLGGSVNF
jgi:hypothetical protein